MGVLPSDRGDEAPDVESEILGQMRPARVITEPLFDPTGTIMRG